MGTIHGYSPKVNNSASLMEIVWKYENVKEKIKNNSLVGRGAVGRGLSHADITTADFILQTWTVIE